MTKGFEQGAHRDAICEAARLAAPIFAAEDWRWALKRSVEDKDTYVPTEQRIGDLYAELTAHIFDGASDVSCGRLMVKAIRNEESDELEAVQFGLELATVWE